MYATGIENKDFSAATNFHDVATTFDNDGTPYAPKDYDLSYRGDVTLRRALSNSLNIPAVEAIQKVGVSTTIKSAQKLGITTFDKDGDYGLAVALGVAPAKLTEMTNAYATFANGGGHNAVTTIDSITDKNNKVILKAAPQDESVISPQTSYIISSILSDNTARAEEFGSSLNLTGGRLAAVKTGTTEDYADAWTIGYTPSLAVGVWIGNNDYSQKMSRVAGSSGAAPIWKSMMQQFLAGTPNEKFTVPAGLTTRSVCRSSGAVAATASSSTITEYFIPGTLPTTTCNKAVPAVQTPVVAPKEQDDSTGQTTTTNNSNNGNGNGGSNGNGNGNNGNSNGNQNPTLPVTPITPTNP
jgi:membrane carboxypeptidase/penicillin-binding protein